MKTSCTLLPALAALTLLLAACGEDFQPVCSVDADCGAVGTCNTSAGACEYPVGSCASAADCEAGQQCDGATATARGTCRSPSTTFDCAEQLEPDSVCATLIPNTRCDLTTGACVPAGSGGCTTSAECDSGQVCSTLGGAGMCVNADCTLQPSAFCESVQAGTICNPITAACVPRASSRSDRYIMIQDVSSGASSCSSMTASGLADAGSDITSITLLDNFGVVLGYGRAVGYIQGNGRVDTTNSAIFNGDPFELDGRGCPSDGFTTSSVVSLGCGGALFAELVGMNNAPISLSSGMELIVGEYAPVCNEGGGSAEGLDRYVVSLCDVPEGEEPDETSCDDALGAARGGDSVWSIP